MLDFAVLADLERSGDFTSQNFENNIDITTVSKTAQIAMFM